MQIRYGASMTQKTASKKRLAVYLCAEEWAAVLALQAELQRKFNKPVALSEVVRIAITQQLVAERQA